MNVIHSTECRSLVKAGRYAGVMTDVKRRITKPAAERRREIVDAALKLFSERGYQETTVQDIAAEASLATGSVYIYFPSKEAVLYAINERFYDGLTERLADVVE